MSYPPLEELALTPAHRQQLTHWLWEWNLFLAMQDQEEITPAPSLSAASGPHDGSLVQPGDIRLLHPDIEFNAVRYIAIIGTCDGNDWTVVPFGRFATPATPEEIRTDRDCAALRVLCCWNRFHMPTALLQPCWLVDHLTDEENRWIHSALPTERTGPPLRHPLDPRWDYVEMESEFRQRVSMAGQPTTLYDISDSKPYLKAAEDAVPYGKDNKDDET